MESIGKASYRTVMTSSSQLQVSPLNHNVWNKCSTGVRLWTKTQSSTQVCYLEHNISKEQLATNPKDLVATMEWRPASPIFLVRTRSFIIKSYYKYNTFAAFCLNCIFLHCVGMASLKLKTVHFWVNSDYLWMITLRHNTKPVQIPTPIKLPDFLTCAI